MNSRLGSAMIMFRVLAGAVLALVVFTAPVADLPQTARAAGPYVVTVDSDGPDSNTGDGACYDGVNGCTLRAAIQQASADGGGTSITFSSALSNTTLSLQNSYG